MMPTGFYYSFVAFDDGTPSGHETRYWLPRQLPDFSNPLELASMAKAAAQDFFYEHDGSEYKQHSWPFIFEIYQSEDGPPVARVPVSMDIEPVFEANWRKIEIMNTESAK